MKASELRIGNLVQYSGSILVIGNISRTDKLNGVTPIPLTEEWLLKFGNWDMTDEGLLSYDLKWDEQLEEWLFYVYNLRGDKINCAAIKYVHQLQNLYFALTGEELKTKENEENV